MMLPGKAIFYAGFRRHIVIRRIISAFSAAMTPRETISGYAYDSIRMDNSVS